MSLSEKLNSYPKKYWDVGDYRKDNPIIRYPATMVAPMQECILNEVILSDETIRNVLDPFSGSGTVLLEGQKLDLDVIGFDINPLAILISEVQLKGVDPSVADDKLQSLYSRIAMLNGNALKHNFKNIDKWFSQNVIVSLSTIRQAIIGEKDDRYRKFFWCCFAETVKKYCNSRTSTFKLHIKTEDQIDSMVDDSISYFKKHTQNQIKKYCKELNEEKIDLRCGNSIELLDELKPNSVDLICTSPPYGDNPTTVTYGQYSILPLLWIDSKDLSLWNNDLLCNFSMIDRLSLGGKLSRDITNDYSDYVKGITYEKQKKIISFFYDYEEIFSRMANVIKKDKLIILTLGNRRVDNKEVRFDVFNDMLADKYNLKLDSTITRNIIGKRMPSKVSSVKDVGSVSSISTEYVKIYRKM